MYWSKRGERGLAAPLPSQVVLIRFLNTLYNIFGKNVKLKEAGALYNRLATRFIVGKFELE